MGQHISSCITALGAAGVAYAVFYIVPPAQGMGEKVRLAFFHIPVAWVSVLAFVLSAFWALRYLQTRQVDYDQRSSVAAGLGLAFCLVATVSGAIFAKITWGAYWNWDPRQTSIFILLLIYGAGLSLRSAIEDGGQRAKISAVYSLLSFLTMPFLVFVIPRYYFSLHPAPVINSSGRIDMDPLMLYVLLAAVIVFTAIFWRLLQYGMRRARHRDLAAMPEADGWYR